MAITNQLLKVRNSPLHESYKRTLTCGSVILQADNVLTSKYCNNRWCLVCNRIRTAKMINGYAEPLSQLEKPYLVTLTVPNVTRVNLHNTIDLMLDELARMRDTMRKRKRPAIGIRKIEVTYNPVADTYHPHLHLIIDGVDRAGELHDLWLERFPNAKPVAQDIRKAKAGTEKELFKYFTKLITRVDGKSCFIPLAMDVIFRAMKGRRVFQPLGIRKDVDEDVDELYSKEFRGLDPGERNWFWDKGSYDWVCRQTGELLTGYEPGEVLHTFLDQIRAGPP